MDLDYQTKRRFNAAMYVVSSADKAHEYYPSLAEKSPERVVLSAVVKAARHSADQMLAWMQRTDTVVAGKNPIFRAIAHSMSNASNSDCFFSCVYVPFA